MELRGIKYKKIYGYLSGELTFKTGENFLVGINGCGKTTVLNLIKWLLEPSLADLCTLDHEYVSLEFKHEKYLYTLKSEIKNSIHELQLITKDKTHNYHPITTTLHLSPNLLKNQEFINEAKKRYSSMTPDLNEVATWHFLVEELPSPVFIGLGRSIDGKYLLGSHKRSAVLRERNRPESLPAATIATELMRDAYNTVRQQIVEINEDLNRKVLELSFSGLIRNSSGKNKSRLTEIRSKISKLKENFTTSSGKGKYSKTLSDQGVRNAIIEYLKGLEKLLDQSKAVDQIMLILNGHNFERAANMFDLFEEHENRAREAQSEIDTFTEVVNEFITDSGKKINFHNDTGTPYFTRNADNRRMLLCDLSSGEAQIVILLTYFAFLAKKGVPIIIDEPELSLHVQWQEKFVTSVKRVLPSECQTLMATHSPEICGAEEVNVQPITVSSNQ
ncbi:AAA family ATPase [Luteolibacter pohnpeiensis]|uniref:AAA family ATPase n=1 Tax=Luteolibacter pohnpeiensis TaxID=454153 RepID=A0A934SA26_9BACT|nr:AAA family ATPase [Luteolibacter pohnpeiensis]MBK1884608.1 AAA family ATPase [Luteolibacter pohnpeiensis]